MVRIPDAATHRRDFGQLPMPDRRAVLKAVNRGQPVERTKLAGHAVVVARRQRKLWARMPIAGPFVALTQIGLGWQAVLVSAVISTLAMVAISRFWWARAGRAEAANLALTTEGKRKGKRASEHASERRAASADEAPPSRRGLPGRRGRTRGRTAGDEASDAGARRSTSPGARAHLPSRRER